MRKRTIRKIKHRVKLCLATGYVALLAATAAGVAGGLLYYSVKPDEPENPYEYLGFRPAYQSEYHGVLGVMSYIEKKFTASPEKESIRLHGETIDDRLEQ